MPLPSPWPTIHTKAVPARAPEGEEHIPRPTDRLTLTTLPLGPTRLLIKPKARGCAGKVRENRRNIITFIMANHAPANTPRPASGPLHPGPAPFQVQTSGQKTIIGELWYHKRRFPSGFSPPAFPPRVRRGRALVEIFVAWKVRRCFECDRILAQTTDTRTCQRLLHSFKRWPKNGCKTKRFVNW